MNKQVEQIRAEIERRRDFFYERYVKKGRGCIEETRYDECVEILSFIDSQPEEQPSKDLEEAAEKYADSIAQSYSQWIYCKDDFIAGAEWGEKNAYKAIMKKADEVRDKMFDTDYEVKIEPAAGFDLGGVSVYHEGRLVGQCVEPKEEKKLPEGIDEAAEHYEESESWRYEALPDPIKRAFKAGAEWQKEQMAVTDAELADEIDKVSKRYPEVSFAKLSRIAKHFYDLGRQASQVETTEKAIEWMKHNLYGFAVDFEHFRKTMEDKK